MKSYRRILAAAGAAFIFMLSGCGQKPLPQVEQNYEGLPTAVIEIENFGTVRAVLFEEQCPKTVENFITHAENGYYDGLIFHRVIEDFMIQGGDPEGTGAGGESIWGAPFEDEFDETLRNFRGALSMANSGKDTNGSQFFIVQHGNGAEYTEEYMKQISDPVGSLKDSAKELKAEYNDPSIDQWIDQQIAAKKAQLAQYKAMGYPDQKFPDAVKEQYQKTGGAPWLDMRHTVFGQVIEGMDVVDAVAAVNVTNDDRPVNEVVISSITIER